MSLISLNSILNKGSPQSIISTFPGVTFLNAKRGQIGTKFSRIELLARREAILGGNPIYVDFLNPAQPVRYMPGNKPCLTKFRGKVLPCLEARFIIFNALPKRAFRLFFMNSINLGIGYPPAVQSNIQYSPFGQITAVSSDLSRTDS